MDDKHFISEIDIKNLEKLEIGYFFPVGNNEAIVASLFQ